MVKHEDRSLGRNTGREERQISAENIDFTGERARISRRESTEEPGTSINYKVVGSDIAFRDDENKKERSHSEKLLSQAIKGEYSYGKLGLILGLAAIIGGVVLCLNGVVGSTSWTARVLGMESQINDAAPGVVLFIVGLFMIWATKPDVKLKNLKG
ncbi:hypothetical protein KAW18_18810 [candidate division WOR-3 bacterium]|nr:hypothetical protein [candidate division WOR-3 bacterium]